MPKTKGGPRARQRHKKILKKAKGYKESRSKTVKRAKEAVVRAGEHAFAGRKERKRQMRSLWISRISGALTEKKLNYSRFIKGLKDANINLNRKMLSEMAINHPEAFDEVVEKAESTLKS